MIPLGHMKLASQDQKGWVVLAGGLYRLYRCCRLPILRYSKVVSSFVLGDDELIFARVPCLRGRKRVGLFGARVVRCLDPVELDSERSTVKELISWAVEP